MDGTPQPEAVFTLLWDQDNGILTITGSGFAAIAGPLTYQAFDSSGRLVLYGQTALHHAVDLSSFAPGLYTIRVNAAAHTASGRIMKF
ncbi:MAG: T9SS type A sorting domain-containing protein [Flavobacteriales bacterium]|nr:T9SS type A sorting domain-containing protein [Flavobacteriales bacterium]